MEAVQAGSTGAFQVLYDRHHRALFTFLIRALGDRRAAEDLLQETFLRAFARRAEYRPAAAVRTWLFTIARNLVVDEYRRPGARLTSEGGQTPEAIADPGASPLERAEATELGRRLGAAVRRLPPAQREVLLLSRVAGLDVSEVAEITGTSPGAVRVALHRALRRLGELLGPV